MDCPARGQVGEGNIRIHSRQRQRYRCQVCGKTFSARVGTPFYRRRTDETMITWVVSLVGNGCPIPAIEATFGFQAQTVREWMDAAGAHSEAVHHAEVVHERDLGLRRVVVRAGDIGLDVERVDERTKKSGADMDGCRHAHEGCGYTPGFLVRSPYAAPELDRATMAWYINI